MQRYLFSITCEKKIVVPVQLCVLSTGFAQISPQANAICSTFPTLFPNQIKESDTAENCEEVSAEEDNCCCDSCCDPCCDPCSGNRNRRNNCNCNNNCCDDDCCEDDFNNGCSDYDNHCRQHRSNRNQGRR